MRSEKWQMQTTNGRYMINLGEGHLLTLAVCRPYTLFKDMKHL